MIEPRPAAKWRHRDEPEPAGCVFGALLAIGFVLMLAAALGAAIAIALEAMKVAPK